MTGNEALLGLLQGHLVALLVRVKADSSAKWQIVAYTCFVLEVGGQRWLATAGHILKDLYALIPRCSEVNGDLFDDWDQRAMGVPIPFDVAGADHIEIDEHGLDLGLIRLEDHYWRLLTANGILPFNERTWKEPDQLSDFVVQGLPTQLSSPAEDDEGALGMRLGQALIHLRRVEPPESMRTAFPRFFGRLADQLKDKTGEELKEIDGLSGAPIIGFKRDDKGMVMYYLVAVQSRWLRRERILAGPLIAEVVKLIAAARASSD